MTQNPLQLIPTQQSRQLVELAERARLGLSRFADTDVEYNAVGLQLLDEWIDRHLKQFPRPSKEIVMAWGTFLGETFRRRFGGEWGLNNAGNKPRLGIVAAKGETDLLFIDIMDQMQRRIKDGMNESLAFYYTIKGVELRRE
ncbi:MAG TPA: hypothetical protein PKZ84_05545 [Anaerolineae bacterium]|nr:hypothetical protein [Anaerolineae bacterium]HQI83930.1 hypothetical protein [Anaerolineae bacterium]